MKNTKLLIIVLVVSCLTGCNRNDDAPNPETVRIRVSNTGTIPLDTVIIDHLTFLNIAHNQLSEYQVFTSEIGLPPSYFKVRTNIGERAVVYDYLQGATLENGRYTYEISMKNNGDIVIVFPPD